MHYVYLRNIMSSCRRAFLRLWKNRFGTDATYGNLLKVCLENENAICAKVITDVLSGKVA